LSPNCQSVALHFAAMRHQLQRDAGQARRCAEASMAVAAEHGFSFWRAGGTVLSGWALAAGGAVEEGLDRLRQGTADWLATDSVTYLTYYLGLQAEVLVGRGRGDEALRVLGEALALVRQTGEGLYEAELHRLRGEALRHEPRRAEEEFLQALDVARQQEARALELRTAMSLARLGPRPGSTAQARGHLLRAYEAFTEGLHTSELREARKLLESLA
jgi:predicted ATPase